jgi:hypothetical protein
MTSPQFLARANEAVARAARGLEANGIQPAYVGVPSGNGRNRTIAALHNP